MASPLPSLDYSISASHFPRRRSSTEHPFAPPTPSPLSPFSISSTPTTQPPAFPQSFSTNSHYYRPPRSSLTSPTRSNISSPTGSPTRTSRQTRIQSLLASDPLLCRLTPTTITRHANDPEFGFTAAEKEWSIRAANGIVKVGEWLREVEGWNLNWRRAGGRRGSNTNTRDMAAGYLPPMKRRKLTGELSDGEGAMGSIEEVDEDDVQEMGSIGVGKKTRRKLFMDRSTDTSDNEEQEALEVVLSPPVESRPSRKPLTPYQLKMQRQRAAADGETPTQKKQQQTPLPTPQQTPVTAKKVVQTPRKARHEVEGESSEEEGGEDEEEYWGSLKKSTLEHYESRIAFILSEIEELDVEALKSKVLSYRTGITNPLTDSSAIITATTLQLLPPLHRLTKLLSVWTVRLAVLRIVPVFLRWLSAAKDALDAGYVAITHPSISPNHPSNANTTIWRGLEEETYTLLQETITQKVATAGRLMDTMLDALEGREDVLPEIWISELEEIEERVGAWEMDGERIVLEGRLRLDDFRHFQSRHEEMEREREKTALVLEQERSVREAEMVASEVDEVMERAEETERGLREAIEANEVVAEGIELGDNDGADSPSEDGRGEWAGRELLTKLESVEKMRLARAGSISESDTETEGEWVDANEERGRSTRWGSYADIIPGGLRGHGLSLDPIEIGRRSSSISNSSTPFMTPMPTPWFAQNGYAQEIQTPRGLAGMMSDVAPVRTYPVMHPTTAQTIYPGAIRDQSTVIEDRPVTPSTPQAVSPTTTEMRTPTQTSPYSKSHQTTPTPATTRPISPRTPSPKAQRERISPPSPEVIRELPLLLAAARSIFQVEIQQEAERKLERKSEKVLTAQIKAEEKERQKHEEEEIDRLAELEAARFFEECEKAADADAEDDDDDENWSDEKEGEEQKIGADTQRNVEGDLWAVAEEAGRKLKDAEAEAEAEAARQETIEEAEYHQRVAAEEAKWAAEAEAEAERRRLAKEAEAEEEAERRRRDSIERVSSLEAARLATEAEHQRILHEEAALIVEEERQRLAEQREVEAEAERQKLAEAEAERQKAEDEEKEAERKRISAATVAAAAALVAAAAAAAIETEQQKRNDEAARFAVAEGKRIEAEAKRLAEEETERRNKVEAERLAAIEAAQHKAEAEAEVERQQKLETERLAAIEAARLAAEAEAKVEAERLRLVEEEAERQRIAAAEAEAERQRKLEDERLATLEAARLAAEAEAKAETERRQKLETERLVAMETARLAAEAEAKAETERMRLAEEEAERQRTAAAEAEAEKQRELEAERLVTLKAARLTAEAKAKAEAERIRLAEEVERQQLAEAAAAAEAKRQHLIEEEAARVAVAKEEEKAAEAEAERQRLVKENAENERKLKTERLAALEVIRLKAEAEAAEEEAAHQRRAELEQLAALETARLSAVEMEHQRMANLEAERRKAIEEEARRNAEAHAEAIRRAEAEVARQRKEELERLAAIEVARAVREEAEQKRTQAAETERLRIAREETEHVLEVARAAAKEEEAERQRVRDERNAEVDRLAELAASRETERRRALADQPRLAAEAEAKAERDISAGLEALRIAKAEAQKAENKRRATLQANSVASGAEAQRLAALEERRLAYERSKRNQFEEDAALAAALAEAERIEAEEGHNSNGKVERLRLETEACALRKEQEEAEEQERIMAAIFAAETAETRREAHEAEETRRREAAQQAEWDAEDEEERRLVALIQKAAADAEAEDARREVLEAEELRQMVAAQEAQWEAEEEEERRMIAEIQRVAREEEERWAAEEEVERRQVAELQKQAQEEAKRQEALEEEMRRKIADQEALWAAEEEEELQTLAAIQQSAAEAEEREREEQRLAEEEAERYRLQVEASRAEEVRAFEELDRQRRLAEDERQRLADLALAEQEKQRLAAQEAERLKMEREIEETRIKAELADMALVEQEKQRLADREAEWLEMERKIEETRIKAELAREEEERQRQESLLSVEKHTGSNSEGGSVSGDDVTEEYHHLSHVDKSPPRKDDEDSEWGKKINRSKSPNSEPSVPPPSVEMTPVSSRSPSLGWSPQPTAATLAPAKTTQEEVSEGSSEFDSEVDIVAAENRAAHDSLQRALNNSARYKLPQDTKSPNHSISEISFTETPAILVAPSTPQKSFELDESDHTPRTTIWDHSANSPVFDDADSYGDESFPSVDESNYQGTEEGPDEESFDFDMIPIATSTPKPVRRLGRLSGLDSITEVLTPHSPHEQFFKAPDGSPLNDTPSKRGKGQNLMLPDGFSRDGEDSGGSEEHSNDRRQWAAIPLNLPSARPGSSMSNRSSMSNISTKKRMIPETKPPIKVQRSQRFIRKAPLDMGRPRSLSSTSDRPRPSSSASDYATPNLTVPRGGPRVAPKVVPKVAPKEAPKGTLGPAMKAIRRPRKDIDSDDESDTEEPRRSRSRENTPDWKSSPPTPNSGAAPQLNIKKHTRQPSKFTSQVTPENKHQNQSRFSHNHEDSSTGPHRPPKLEFPQSSLDDKVNEILTALASPIRLTASNLQKLTDTTNKRQPPLRPFELPTPSGIPAPKSIGSNPSMTSDATSFSRGGRKHIPNTPGDIKLYHLHRSDGQAPIKLYIRLVGERGERVMVRVGGGWADLAEYLKEYATHHGSKRRVVGEGRIEIQDLGGTAHHHTLNPSRSISSLRSASPAPGSRSSSPLPTSGRSRSVSAAGLNRRAESPMLGRRAESPLFPSPPPAVMRGGHNGTLTTKDLPVTPTLTAFQPLTYQRQSGLSPPTGSRPPSRPGSSHSTAGVVRRSASRLSFTESAFDGSEIGGLADQIPPKPLGLAGPKGKNNEISPENQAWVEGMLGEVRKVSAHRRRRLTGGSNNGDERDAVLGELVELQPAAGGTQFGGRLGISDMGKQGGTRRVFPKKQG